MTVPGWELLPVLLVAGALEGAVAYVVGTRVVAPRAGAASTEGVRAALRSGVLDDDLADAGLRIAGRMAGKVVERALREVVIANR